MASVSEIRNKFAQMSAQRDEVSSATTEAVLAPLPNGRGYEHNIVSRSPVRQRPGTNEKVETVTKRRIVTSDEKSDAELARSGSFLQGSSTQPKTGSFRYATTNSATSSERGLVHTPSAVSSAASAAASNRNGGGNPNLTSGVATQRQRFVADGTSPVPRPLPTGGYSGGSPIATPNNGLLRSSLRSPASQHMSTPSRVEWGSVDTRTIEPSRQSPLRVDTVYAPVMYTRRRDHRERRGDNDRGGGLLGSSGGGANSRARASSVPRLDELRQRSTTTHGSDNFGMSYSSPPNMSTIRHRRSGSPYRQEDAFLMSSGGRQFNPQRTTVDVAGASDEPAPFHDRGPRRSSADGRSREGSVEYEPSSDRRMASPSGVRSHESEAERMFKTQPALTRQSRDLHPRVNLGGGGGGGGSFRSSGGGGSAHHSTSPSARSISAGSRASSGGNGGRTHLHIAQQKASSRGSSANGRGGGRVVQETVQHYDETLEIKHVAAMLAAIRGNFPSDAPAYADAAFRLLHRGTYLIKYGKGAPHERFVTLRVMSNKDDGSAQAREHPYLTVQLHAESTWLDERFHLSHLVGVARGTDSPGFRTHLINMDAIQGPFEGDKRSRLTTKYAFSLIFESRNVRRSVDLLALDDQTFRCWLLVCDYFATLNVAAPSGVQLPMDIETLAPDTPRSGSVNPEWRNGGRN